METIRVQIDEAHSLDIIDGEELQNQPMEARDNFNEYVYEKGILLLWTRNADEWDKYSRPTHWSYNWGDLVVEIVRRYKYDTARDWSPTAEVITLSKSKANV
jgi:hypothetical protein